MIRYMRPILKRNAAYLSEGVKFQKQRRGGAAGGNDASAEYMAKLHGSADEDQLVIVTAELRR